MIIINLEGRRLTEVPSDCVLHHLRPEVIVSGVKALLIFVSTDARVQHCHPESVSD